MDTLWNEFPLEPAPAVERLESPRVAPLQSGSATPVGGGSNELPVGIFLWLAAAAAGVALGAKAARAHAVQDLVSDGFARRRTTGVPRVHVPRPQLPRVHVPRPQLPRVQLPRPQLPRPQLPRLHVPRPHLPRLYLPRPQVPRPRLPQLPSSRVVQHLAEALDRGRQTFWRADVLFWTSAMAAAAAFGVLIAFVLGGP